MLTSPGDVNDDTDHDDEVPTSNIVIIIIADVRDLWLAPRNMSVLDYYNKYIITGIYAAAKWWAAANLGQAINQSMLLGDLAHYNDSRP